MKELRARRGRTGSAIASEAVTAVTGKIQNGASSGRAILQSEIAKAQRIAAHVLVIRSKSPRPARRRPALRRKFERCEIESRRHGAAGQRPVSGGFGRLP